MSSTVLFYACDTRCKTTKSLLEAIVKEFNMSRKQGDFFCGRRVRVTPEALIVSQELAASSLAPMELCGTQRSPETMLTYSEHIAVCWENSNGYNFNHVQICHTK